VLGSVIIFRRSNDSFTFKCVLRGKLYLVYFGLKEVELDKCLIAKRNMSWLWHRSLACVGMRNIHKHQKEGHILGLTNIVFEKDRPCEACQARKQVRAPHYAKNIMTTTRPFEMLHMDLFGPITYISIVCNKYGPIVDDYSHFTWVFFLHDKSETQEVLKKFLKMVQNEFDVKVKKMRSDNCSGFRILKLKIILIKKVSSMNFWHPILLNKIGRSKERIGPSLSRQGQCLMNTRPPIAFRLKLSTRHVMSSTGSTFTDS
jgi:hypothetical protein